MKRLNPETNQPFERGYQREDGRYFFQYTIKKIKRNGFFEEKWLSKAALDHYRAKQRELKKIWGKNNLDKVNAKSNKRRAKKLERIPRWIKDVFLKEIDEYYTMAKELEKVFPWKQHVDHIVPMNGKNVSGLHVPWNLQILSQKANQEKGNKHVEEDTTPSIPAGHYSKSEEHSKHGTLLATGAGEDDDHPHHHCGADARQDVNHCTEEGSGDGMAHRNKKVEPSPALTGRQDNGEPCSETSGTELRGGRLFD